MIYWTVIANLIALSAVFVSVLAYFETRRTNRRVLALQEEQSKLTQLQRVKLEREEAELTKCEIGAYWYKGINNSDRIHIENTGKVEVCNVTFSFRPLSGRTSPEVESEMADIFPIKSLRVGQSHNFLIAPTMATGHRWPVTISWEDETGNSYTTNYMLGMS